MVGLCANGARTTYLNANGPAGSADSARAISLLLPYFSRPQRWLIWATKRWYRPASNMTLPPHDAADALW